MEFGHIVTQCLDNMRSLVFQKNFSDYDALDYQICLSLHNLRLYCAFTDEPQHRMIDWKSYIIDKINAFICKRNTLYAKSHPYFYSELGLNGPMGIVLYLTNIPECFKCYDDIGEQHAPSNLEIRSQCGECDKWHEEIVLSRMCDIHAPWRCHECGGCHMRAVSTSQRTYRRSAFSYKHKLSFRPLKV